MISVIFPAHNEEENVGELHRRIKEVMEGVGVSYEIIAIDDGSTDSTLLRLRQLAPIKIIVFSKKMGQSAALDAGFKNAKGDIVITIDADLQNRPEDIPHLVDKLNEGYDVVSGWRMRRNDRIHRRIISRVANTLTSRITGIPMKDSAAPLKAMRSVFLQDVNLYGEMHSFLPSILYARGARVIQIPVPHYERKFGMPKYHTTKLLKSFGDLLVVKFMNDHLARPFHYFGGWGLASIIFGFVAGSSSIVLKLMQLKNFTQTPLPLLAVLLIVIGVILVMMGFIAEILLRIYYETRGKTPYIIKSVEENK